MGIFFGLLKFQIFFGMPDIPDICWGVNSRCWVQAYVAGKMRVLPPPWDANFCSDSAEHVYTLTFVSEMHNR